MNEPGNEDAFTGLELIILIVIMLAVGLLLVILFNGNTATSSPQGLIIHSVSMTSTGIRLVGGVTGFAATDGKTSDVFVRYRIPDPGKLGSTELTTALFLSATTSTTSGVDMDKATVTWLSNGVAEKLDKTNSSMVVCPGWSIAGKFNMLPGQSADADNILEPNEQFELFICPSNTTLPYQQFTVIIDPARDALPLSVPRNTPPVIRPVMQLG